MKRKKGQISYFKGGDHHTEHHHAGKKTEFNCLMKTPNVVLKSVQFVQQKKNMLGLAPDSPDEKFGQTASPARFITLPECGPAKFGRSLLPRQDHQDNPQLGSLKWRRARSGPRSLWILKEQRQDKPQMGNGNVPQWFVGSSDKLEPEDMHLECWCLSLSDGEKQLPNKWDPFWFFFFFPQRHLLPIFLRIWVSMFWIARDKFARETQGMIVARNHSKERDQWFFTQIF